MCFFLLLAVFIPEVQKKNTLCNNIYWEEQGIGNSEKGSMYSQFLKRYAIAVPKNNQSKFGESLTSR